MQNLYLCKKKKNILGKNYFAFLKQNSPYSLNDLHT